MGWLRKITDYLNEKELEIHFYKDHLNIVNYLEIPDFSSSKIRIKHLKGIITVTGSNLVVSKLLNDEILISGEIKNIEIGE